MDETCVGDKVISRDHEIIGYVTNAPALPCFMEGCWGSQYEVKWEDGHTTWVCGGSVGWSESHSCWYFYGYAPPPPE